MPKISTYTTTPPALDDKLLGTDVNGTPTDATKNFTVEGVRDLILPATSTETPTLTDKVFGSNDSGDPRVPNRNFTLQGVKDLIAPTEFVALNFSDDADQELSAANVKQQVTFGVNGGSTAYFDLDANGTITTTIAGTYRVRASFNSGCLITPQQANEHIDYFYSIEKNGSQTQSTIQNTVFFDALDTDPAQSISMEYVFDLAVNDELEIFQAASVYVASTPAAMRSGLVARNTSVQGMNAVPSAAIYITKL